ncbi:histidine phosphatase family protein, partial [Pseudomonas sp. PNPG3]|nr:histidine phosphatase family protein [Pseudomonas sp. PNPG3]
ITRIFASDLARARSTAQALATATGLQVTLDEGLREISVGEWEGFTRDEIEQKWPDLLAKWKSGAEVRPPG